jgi:6-phosphogluconolactonase
MNRMFFAGGVSIGKTSANTCDVPNPGVLFSLFEESRMQGKLIIATLMLLGVALATGGAFAQTQNAAASPQTGPPPTRSSAADRSALYASAGFDLTRYEVHLDPPSLEKKEAVMLPGRVQHAWPHPSNRYLYVAWSEGPGDRPNGLSAFSIDASSGALTPHGEVALTGRAIDITVDITGTHVLVLFPTPSALTIYRLNSDGTIGAEMKQRAPIDVGVFPHQVRVDPSNGVVVVAQRGYVPAPGKPGDPGALRLFSYKDGELTTLAKVAPNGGSGFQVRNVDFHPSGKWVFASLEAQNVLHVFERQANGLLGPVSLFTKQSLFTPVIARPGFYQRSGVVRVHPNGRFVYQADRASDRTDGAGSGAWGGGTNAIGVFAINQGTGEPTLIQTADTHGSVPRTFAFDVTARILVAGNEQRIQIKDGENVSVLPASLALFRVLANGKLDYVRRYEVETKGSDSLWWMGIIPLPH